MITGFEWIIISGITSFFAGVAVAAFWDNIKAWASRMLGYILDAVNWAIEVTFDDAITSLVKVGYRYYKSVEVWVRNIRSNKTERRFKKEEVPPAAIPAEIEEQLNQKREIKLRTNINLV